MSEYATLWSGGKDGCLAHYLYGREGNCCKKLFTYVGAAIFRKKSFWNRVNVWEFP